MTYEYISIINLPLIEHGQLTHEEAIALVKQHDLWLLSPEFLEPFAAFIGMTSEQCHEVLEQNRNPKIWQVNKDETHSITHHLEFAG